MKILGLPGIKVATLTWMQTLIQALDSDSFTIEIRQYRHWADESDADADFEAAGLRENPTDLVIAKSLGTFIATRAFAQHGFRPRKAVFIGTPLGRFRADNEALLANFVTAVPTLFIQQAEDFNGPCRELTAVVADFANATVAEVPGGDHVYSDIVELKNLVQPFIAPVAE